MGRRCGRKPACAPKTFPRLAALYAELAFDATFDCMRYDRIRYLALSEIILPSARLTCRDRRRRRRKADRL